MRHLILLLAVLAGMAAHAEEANDTTFTVKDKKIVVDVQDDRTTVKVYNERGYQMSKTREMEFVDGQEVEQVYVGSPLIPVENLQNIKFRSHFPLVWYGVRNISEHFYSTSGGDVHGRRKGSFELGITPWSFAVPFNKARTVGLVGGVQLAWIRQRFSSGYAITQQDGLFKYTPLAQGAKSNNMDFGVLRIPVLLSLQSEYSGMSTNIGLSAEMRTNAAYRFNPASGSNAPQVPNGLKLNRFGLNFEFGFTLGCVTLQATAGITPLFKTVTGQKAFYTSANFGIDIYGIGSFFKGRKKK